MTTQDRTPETRIARLEALLDDRESIHVRRRWNRRIRLAALGAALSAPLVAWAFDKPHPDFGSGDPIVASDVNETIDDIYASLDQVQAEYSGCRADMTAVGGWCIDDAISDALGYEEAKHACLADDKDLCNFDALQACDFLEPSTSACADSTDGLNGMSPVWVGGAAIVDGQNWLDTVAVYGGSNIMTLTDDNDPVRYYCCTPRIPVPPAN